MSEGSEAGTEFGPYRLCELLGRGGMGEVWRAFDTRRERMVALKRMATGWAADVEFRERFRREARLTARLASGHVIPIHDFGEIDGRLYVDMRLVEGADLAAVLAASPGGLAVPRAVEISGQIAAALDAAHAAGLVHRDVKPSNVLIEHGGSTEFAYLVDFGIARSIDAGDRLTATGRLLGTPAYMAPELFYSAESASPASDVYALGCVAFEMLTGSPPFSGPPVTMMRDHMFATPPTPSSMRAELAGVDAAVATALAKEPGARFPSAGALVAALRSGTGADRGVVDAAPPTLADRGTGRGLLVGAAVLVVLALLVVVLVRVVVPSLRPAGGSARSPSVDPGALAPAALNIPADLASSGDVAVSPDGRRVFALRTGQNGALTIVDAATGGVQGVVPVGAFPEDVAVSPDGTRVYVVNQGSVQVPERTMSVIDLAAQRATATVTVGPLPSAVAVSPDGARVFVTTGSLPGDPRSNSVAVVDASSDTVVATVRVGGIPNHMAVARDGRFVYVPNTGGGSTKENTVSVLDTATNAVVRTLTVGFSPRSVAVSPGGDRLYVATAGTADTAARGALDVVDLASGSVTALAPDTVDLPRAVAMSPDGRTLVVTDNGAPYRGGDPANDVLVIDVATGTVQRRAHTAAEPKQIAITPDGRTAYAAAVFPADLWRIPLR